MREDGINELYYAYRNYWYYISWIWIQYVWQIGKAPVVLYCDRDLGTPIDPESALVKIFQNGTS